MPKQPRHFSRKRAAASFRACARALLMPALAGALLAGCGGFQLLDSPAPPPAATPAPAAGASGALFGRPPACVREGDACGPNAECCGGLMCIGSRTSFCVPRS